jgi:hypothetical protein
MSMQGEKSRLYRAYLLRCWREKGEAAPGEEHLWRFSVEEILPFEPSAALRPCSGQGSGQGKLRTLPEQRRKGFTSLGALLAFLRGELARGEEEPSDDRTQ